VYQGHPTLFQGASRRALHDNLPRQLSEALDETSNACSFALQITAHSYFQADTAEDFESHHGNTFTALLSSKSLLCDISVGDLDRVEPEAYQSEVTGGLLSILVYHLLKRDLTAYLDGAVFLGLHRRDASTKNILATLSSTGFINDSADTGGCSHLFKCRFQA
jgi:hypothetical protein